MRSYQQLFAELKRRKVFKVAAVYGAVAFVLLQVADLLGQGLRLPESFMPFITAVILLGFPLALILAWAFEVTPKACSETEAGVGRARSRRSSRCRPAQALAGGAPGAVGRRGPARGRLVGRTPERSGGSSERGRGGGRRRPAWPSPTSQTTRVRRSPCCRSPT